MTTKNKQADDAICRAARYMVAGAVEPHDARAAELHRVAAEAMVEAAQILSGYFGDEIPRGAVETVRDQVLALVGDHFRRLIPAMAPELVGIATEAEAARIVTEQFARSTPIKQ
jgi:hypothetical protein